MNVVEPIEQSCDVQQIFFMKNYVHAPTLAREIESRRNWDSVDFVLS
jgi:hypothetical protein